MKTSDPVRKFGSAPGWSLYLSLTLTAQCRVCVILIPAGEMGAQHSPELAVCYPSAGLSLRCPAAAVTLSLVLYVPQVASCHRTTGSFKKATCATWGFARTLECLRVLALSARVQYPGGVLATLGRGQRAA